MWKIGQKFTSKISSNPVMTASLVSVVENGKRHDESRRGVYSKRRSICLPNTPSARRNGR